MSIMAEQLKRVLDEKKIRYDSFPKTENRNEAIIIAFSGRNTNGLRVNFFFDEGNTINVKVFSIAKANESNLMPIYVKLNELNQKWRWVKFYLDADNEITVSGDVIVDEQTAGAECFEILGRYVDIIDQCYPELMKTIWA